MRFELKGIVYTLMVAGMIGCLWAMGWADSLNATAEQRWWPPLDQDAYQRAVTADLVAGETSDYNTYGWTE